MQKQPSATDLGKLRHAVLAVFLVEREREEIEHTASAEHRFLDDGFDRILQRFLDLQGRAPWVAW